MCVMVRDLQHQLFRGDDLSTGEIHYLAHHCAIIKTRAMKTSSEHIWFHDKERLIIWHILVPLSRQEQGEQVWSIFYFVTRRCLNLVIIIDYPAYTPQRDTMLKRSAPTHYTFISFYVFTPFYRRTLFYPIVSTVAHT